MNPVFLLFLLIFFSCGLSDSEEIEEAIDKANLLLASKSCDKALESLGSVAYQHKNVDYIMAYSSAYACKGDYSSTTFFADDLPEMETDLESMFGSFATFSTSEIQNSEDEKFVHLMTALDTLLMAGNITESSHTNRSAEFDRADVERLEVFALYLIFIQMGRFTHHFGNADSEGIKGGGVQSNSCYLNYTDPSARTIITGVTPPNSCVPDGTTGHPELDRTLKCYGVILFNNLIDIVGNLTFTGTNADGLRDINSVISNFCTLLSSGDALENICTVKTLKSCVDDTTNYTDEYIEAFYAAIYETLHQ